MCCIWNEKLLIPCFEKYYSLNCTKFSFNEPGSFSERWKNQECVWQPFPSGGSKPAIFKHKPWKTKNQVSAILSLYKNSAIYAECVIFAEKYYNIKIVSNKSHNAEVKTRSKRSYGGEAGEHLQGKALNASLSCFLHLIPTLFPILSHQHFFSFSPAAEALLQI